jgi:hypothetical protein
MNDKIAIHFKACKLPSLTRNDIPITVLTKYKFKNRILID